VWPPLAPSVADAGGKPNLLYSWSAFIGGPCLVTWCDSTETFQWAKASTSYLEAQGSIYINYIYTASWPTTWQRPPRCGSYSMSSTTSLCVLPLYIATTSARSTSPPTPCNISAQSTWRSTCTSFVRLSLPVTFGLLSSPPRYSSPTSSPRGYRLVYSQIFNPVSTSVHDRVETTGVLEYPFRILWFTPCNYSLTPM
jgi:hypothetical protein